MFSLTSHVNIILSSINTSAKWLPSSCVQEEGSSLFPISSVHRAATVLSISSAFLLLDPSFIIIAWTKQGDLVGGIVVQFSVGAKFFSLPKPPTGSGVLRVSHEVIISSSLTGSKMTTE